MNDSPLDFSAISDKVFLRTCIVAALYAACFDYGSDPRGPVPATLSKSMKQTCTKMFGASLGDDQRSLTFRLLFAQIYQAVWPYFSLAEHPLAILCIVLQRVERAQAGVTVANFVNQYLAEDSMLAWINMQFFGSTEATVDLQSVQQVAAAAAIYAFWTDYPHLVEPREKGEQCTRLLLLLEREKTFPCLTRILKQEYTQLFRGSFHHFYERLTQLLQADRGMQTLFDRLAGIDEAEGMQVVVQSMRDWLRDDEIARVLEGIDTDLLQEVFFLFRAAQIEALKQESGLIERDEASIARCSARGCDAVRHELVAELTMYFPGRQSRVAVRSCKEHRKQIEAYLTSSVSLRALEEKAEEEQGASIIAPTSMIRYADPANVPSPKRPEKEPLLLERFRLRQRPHPESLIVRRIFAEFGMRGLQFLNTLHDGYIDLAKKYRLNAFSFAVAAYLPQMPLLQSVISALRDHYRWIELETAYETPLGVLAAFSFGVKGERIFQYAAQQCLLKKSMQERLRVILCPEAFDYHIGLDAVDPSGNVFWTLEFAFTRNAQGEREMISLMPTWVRRCGRRECGDNGPLCPQCLESCAYYFSLYANCLCLLRGELRETEDRLIFPVQEEKARRKDPDPQQPRKFKEREVVHAIQVVSFNVLGQQNKRLWNRPQTHRGSWMHKLDPNQIVHWEIDVVFEDGRRLKDPRYRNYILRQGADPDAPEIKEKGFRIEVRSHKRKQAMSLSRLKHHLTEVIAKRELKEQETLERVLEDAINSPFASMHVENG